MVFNASVSVALLLMATSKVWNPQTKRSIQIGGQTYTNLLKHGHIHHDGKLHPIEPRKYDEPILSSEWKILHHDENHNLLFVDKPSGLLSVPGRLVPHSLISHVQEQYADAKLVHRLDRDTSGVMVFALDADRHRQLSKLFEERQTIKVYKALVAGHVTKSQGHINLPIGKEKSPEGFNRWVIGGTKPRDAWTDYEVVERRQTGNGFRYTQVSVQPKTGRGQQIRLHLKALGYPLLGDTLHAPDDLASATPRLCLHASLLSFTLDGHNYHVASPCPF